MSDRKGISARTRFEIFKRDGFRCAYCGSSVTDGPLHVDHIEPVAGGGSDEPENLITSCDRCNLGKSDVPLDERRFQVGDPARAGEHAEQLRRYVEAQKEVIAAKKAAVQQLIDTWCSMTGATEYHRNLETILPRAVAEFGMERVIEFIGIVAANRSSWFYKSSAFEIDCKYFCGILRKRREKGWD